MEGKKDYYTIVKNPLASKSGSGFRLGLERAKDSNKVVLSPVPAEWLFEHVPTNVANGIENVYKSVSISNFTFVLGTNFVHKNHSPGRVRVF